MAVLGLSSCGDWGSLASTAIEVAAADYAIQEYDTNGVPIYGYDGNNAVYGYDSNNQPIYDVALLTTAASVPSWAPRAGAKVIYPARARRIAAPPPRAHRHAPLKHRHPVVHSPRRPDRIAPPLRNPHTPGPGPRPDRAALPLHNPHMSGPGPRPDRAASPLHNPRMSGPGPRPDRAASPSRNPRMSGPGPRPNSHQRVQPGQDPGRMAPKSQHGRPNAGPGSDQKGKPATSTPTAPAGTKVAPVPLPSASVKSSASSSYVCMSSRMGDTLIKK